MAHRPRAQGLYLTQLCALALIENIADEYMEWWGFDPDAIDDWCAENWKWE
jgi:hypothetical protein